MIVKLRQTLAFKIGMVVLASLVLILGSCGVLTYFNQMAVYRQQCETSLRNAGDFLGRLIEADKEDFVRYQAYFLEHYTDVDIPADARDYLPYLQEYERLFETTYPGKSLGVDIQYDELSDEVKKAFLAYTQVYWLQTFENVRESFDLAYIYYILPDSRTESDIYIIDGTFPSRADHIQLMAEYPDEYPAAFDHPQGEEAEYLYLGDQVPNARADYDVKWDVWDTGEKQTGFQVWNNEYGKTYSYYTPVIIDGQKMGLIGADIYIDTVNQAILRSTIRQFLIMGLIIVAGMLGFMWFLNHRFIRKISDLEWRVRDFSKSRNVQLATEVRVYWRQAWVTLRGQEAVKEEGGDFPAGQT